MDHHDSGALLSESYSGGFLAGLAVTNVLDARLRRATNGLTLNSSFLAWTTNAYDNASRLATVGNDTFSSSYAYLAHSPLWGTLTFKQNGSSGKFVPGFMKSE